MVKNNLINLGVLGGSFDPPHKGHVYISKKSIKLFKLKKVIWAITEKNPLKKKTFFSLKIRKILCRKLIKKDHKIILKHYDKKLKSKNTIDLIKFLKKLKKYNIFFIIGSDNLVNFHKWKNYKDLLNMCNFIVFSRKGFDTKAKKSVIKRSLNRKNIKFIENLKIDISSTQLRTKIINGSKKN